jgi:hypothetical protein
MRIVIAFLFMLATAIAFCQMPNDELSTPAQAREYAAEHMWAEVQVLAMDECKWIFRKENGDPGDPGIGDMAIVRNAQYKVLADTTISRIQCSVIDFSIEEMTVEEADSTIRVMLAAYRRTGSFERLADEYLPEDQKYRYVHFNDQSAKIEKIFGDDLESGRKGDLIIINETEEQPFKFLIYIREDPIEQTGFIVLKTRLED